MSAGDGGAGRPRGRHGDDLVRAVQPDDLDALVALIGLHLDAVRGGTIAPRRQLRIELADALFDPPRRCWAWLLAGPAGTSGYALASAGFDPLAAASCLRIEALHVRARAVRTGEERLFAAVLRFARDSGCATLAWTLPPSRAGVARGHDPVGGALTGDTCYRLPLARWRDDDDIDDVPLRRGAA